MAFLPPAYNAFGLGLGIPKPPKRKVFISYHHGEDQYLYNSFSEYFSDTLDLFYDNSLERIIDSDDAEYLNRKIREEYIFGTSITIVLCGAETWKRRWVDWEIHATLWYGHALLGIACPNCTRTFENKFIVHNRLHDNILSGYAHWMYWTQDAASLATAIEEAIRKSGQKKANQELYR